MNRPGAIAANAANITVVDAPALRPKGKGGLAHSDAGRDEFREHVSQLEAKDGERPLTAAPVPFRGTAKGGIVTPEEVAVRAIEAETPVQELYRQLEPELPRLPSTGGFPGLERPAELIADPALGPIAAASLSVERPTRHHDLASRIADAIRPESKSAPPARSAVAPSIGIVPTKTTLQAPVVPSDEPRPSANRAASDTMPPMRLPGLEIDMPSEMEPETPARPDVKLTTLRQETHFNPVVRQSPAIQVAEAVTRGLSQPEATEIFRMPTGIDQSRPISAAPLRVLHVQLQPAELGVVTIHMALRGETLELHVNTQHQAAADLIRQDREMLARLIRSAGYDIETISVAAQVGDGDRAGITGSTSVLQQASTAVQAQTSQLDMGWLQQDGRPRDARSQQGRGHHPQAADGTPGASEGGAGGETPVSRGVYI